MVVGKVQKDVEAVVKGRKLVIKNSVLLPMYTVQLLDNTQVRIYRPKSFPPSQPNGFNNGIQSRDGLCSDGDF
jgi:hypothetical protein